MSKARELAELGAVYDSGALSNRNLLINGAMQVFQRGTSFSGNSAYNADRWKVDNNSDGGGRSTDAPDGFTYSLKIDTSSGNAALRQGIELPAAGEGGVFRSGQKFTLSFYLKSDNAGEAINIFIASSTTVDGTTTAQVNDTSTGLTTTTSWARYTYTFTSNNVGGSDTCYNIVPYVATPSGAVYWTGFQLELGTEATPFEHRSFGQELERCKRYYENLITKAAESMLVTGTAFSTGQVQGVVRFEVEKRATPTMGYEVGIAYQTNGETSRTDTTPLFYRTSTKTTLVYATSGVSVSINEGLSLVNRDNGTGMVFANAEF